MDLATLRAEIEATLSGYLGVYTLANAATAPACSVRRDGERLFPGTKVTGLEVVILAEPRLVPVNGYSQQEALAEWQVFLVGWDATADPRAAAEALVYTFPGTTWDRLNVAQGVGPANQARVVIRSSASGVTVVNPYVYGLPKSFTIPDPADWVADTEGFGVARLTNGVTLKQVYAVKTGAGSVTFELRYGADRSATGTLVTVSTVVTSSTVGQVIPLAAAQIPSGSFLWCRVTAVSGTPTQLEVTLET